MKGTSRWTRWPMVIAVAAAVGEMATVANAQSPSPISFGIVAGGTIPVGDFSDGSGTGWHAGGLVEWNSPTLPVGFRGDLVYHALGGKDFKGGNTTLTFRPKILAGTANLVWLFPMDNGASTVRPYVIGGVGFYNVKLDIGCTGTCTGFTNDAKSETKFGLNGGAGAKFQLSGFETLIEARFHSIFTSCDVGGGTCKSNIVPISVGIVFR